jgi:hypothetical protein
VPFPVSNSHVERERERERAKPARIKEPTQERKTKLPFPSALWNKVE